MTFVMGGGGGRLCALVVLAAALAFAASAGGARAQTPLTLGGKTLGPFAPGSAITAQCSVIYRSPQDPSGTCRADRYVLGAASGGTTPYTYTLAGLPSGLSFDASTRALSGTPAAPQGAYDLHHLTYTVTDSSTPRQTATAAVVVAIEADTTPAFPQSVITKTFYKDRAEEWAFPAASGLNYHFNDSRYSVSPVLPSGVLFGSNNGIATDGTFTIPNPATQDYTLTATDRDGDSGTATLRITYADLPPNGPEFFDESIRIRWIVNGSLDQLADRGDLILPGAGGAATTYALTGTLPAGLTFTGGAATHKLSGKPTELGTFALTLTATDSQSRTDTLQITMIVTPVGEPSWVRPSGASCTSMRVAWQQPRNLGQGKRTPDGYAISGYQIQGQQWGVDTTWRDIASTSGATTTSYLHAGVPPGSSWNYRVRAAVTKTSDQSTVYGPWSPVAGATTTRRADTAASVLEAGQVVRVLNQGALGGSVVGSWQWYRAKDETPVVWTAISGATENLYEFTAADAGHLIRVDRNGLVNFLTHARLRHTGRDTTFLFTIFHIPLPSADNAPSYASPSATHPAVREGDTVDIDLAATGGSAPVTYTLSPALPAGSGLTFGASTGKITGTAAADVRGTYTVTARDADCDAATLTAHVGTTPSAPLTPAPPEGVPLHVKAETIGPAPASARFVAGYNCPGEGGSFLIWPGETRTVWLPEGEPCSLSARRLGGAYRVSGTFEDRTFTQESRVTLVFDFNEEPPPPEPRFSRIEARVWQDLLDPAVLWLSARPEDGSWLELGTVQLARDDEPDAGAGGRDAYGPVTIAVPDGEGSAAVSILVLRDPSDGAVYLNARAEGGSWAEPGPLAVPLDDGLSSTGRYRYGDIARPILLPAP